MKRLPLLLLALSLIIFIAWRWTVINQPAANLLRNPAFEAADLADWKSSQTGEGAINLHDKVLALSIGDTIRGNLAGVGQTIAVSPEQRYLMQFEYRLRQQTDSTAELILRVTQRNTKGEEVAKEDFSDRRLLTMPLDQNTPLDYTFETTADTVSVEVAIGLYGQAKTLVELDNFSLHSQVTQSIAWWQDSPILAALLGLGGLLTYLFSEILTLIIKRNRRLIALVSVNVMLFVLFAEGFALSYYFITQGNLFYTNHPYYDMLGDSTSRALTQYRLQPYFGFTLRPDTPDERAAKLALHKWQDPGANNYGFYSPYDYPLLKTKPKQFFIGIFGGSVGQFFALQGRDELIKRLQAEPQFADKEIILLNFALASYKQPQQLQVLSYFLSLGQPLDMVINIDGFNEAALSSRNYQNHQLEFSMPNGAIILPMVDLIDQTTLTPEKLEQLAMINRTKNQLDMLAGWINHSWSAALTFVLEQSYRILQSRYQATLVELQAAPLSKQKSGLVYLNPATTRLSNEALFARIADNWVKSSQLMADITQRQQIAYYHFFQPNQYFSHHHFSPEEADVALRNDSQYKAGVEAGYPILLDMATQLTGYGINYYDATAVFDKAEGRVFVDSCCHYTDLGNEILADFIADQIIAMLP